MTVKVTENSKKYFKIPMAALFLLPLLMGSIVRIFLFYQWYNSPFRYYHTVRGLDMMTLLKKGESFFNGNETFTPFNLLIAIVRCLFPRQLYPEGIIITQMALGLLTVLLCTWITLMLTGKKKIAIIAGITASTYAPSIVFETQILKSSLFLFLATLTLALLIYAKKKSFHPVWTILAGFTAMLPFWERFSGLLWTLSAIVWILAVKLHFFIHLLKNKQNLNKNFEKDTNEHASDKTKTNRNVNYSLMVKTTLYPVFLFAVGIMLAFAAVFSINSYNNKSSHYFKVNLSYVLRTGSSKKPNIGKQQNMESSSLIDKSTPQAKFLKKTAHYFKKMVTVAGPLQIPNNINYYFVKTKIPILNILPGPILIIPLALTGLIILIINLRFLKKESILFFYLFAFIVPIIVFLPLARYKTLLLPIISFATAFSIFHLIEIRIKQKFSLKNIFLFLSPAIFFIIISISQNSISRHSTDLYAYAYAAVYIPSQLMENGQFKDAEYILSKYKKQTPGAPLLSIFLSSSYMGQGKFRQAEKLLKGIPVPIRPNLRGRYLFNLAESVRFQNKNNEAAAYYSQVLATPYSYAISKQLRKYITRFQKKTPRIKTY